eukprot:TRINITY_DN8757_c0_g1_i8.p1 TRINITY_DN8757_c0_g1~~TRINITY_DN8757_c0_g1_i8.p1  ORF type:complete len:117 (-),score=1.49 TRINITY_DN8757_c0_g1_i8:18-323(-)
MCIRDRYSSSPFASSALTSLTVAPSLYLFATGSSAPCITGPRICLCMKPRARPPKRKGARSLESKDNLLNRNAMLCCVLLCVHGNDAVSYTHLTLPTICSV